MPTYVKLFLFIPILLQVHTYRQQHTHTQQITTKHGALAFVVCGFRRVGHNVSGTARAAEPSIETVQKMEAAGNGGRTS